MRIRARESSDLGSCVELLHQTHSHNSYPLYWPPSPDAFLASPAESMSWVAVEGDRVIGHVALHNAQGDPAFAAIESTSGGSAAEYSVIARLVVGPASQGNGVGAALLDVAVNHARGMGHHPILDVLTTSLDAIAFYESCGWVRVDEVEILLSDEMTLSAFVYVAPKV